MPPKDIEGGSGWKELGNNGSRARFTSRPTIVERINSMRRRALSRRSFSSWHARRQRLSASLRTAIRSRRRCIANCRAIASHLARLVRVETFDFHVHHRARRRCRRTCASSRAFSFLSFSAFRRCLSCSSSRFFSSSCLRRNSSLFFASASCSWRAFKAASCLAFSSSLRFFARAATAAAASARALACSDSLLACSAASASAIFLSSAAPAS